MLHLLPRRLRAALPMDMEDFGLCLCNGLLSTADAFMRVVGPVMVVLAYTLIALFTVTYFDTIAPFYNWSAPAYCAVTVPGLLLLCGALCNYTTALCTGPGYVDAAVHALKGADDAAGAYSDDEDGGGGGGSLEDGVTWTRCSRECRALRPPRAHHCHVSRRCVLRMDHYCPWLNQCVGWGNYAYFWRTLAFVTLGTGFVAAVACAPFLRSLSDAGYPAPGAGGAGRWQGAWVLLSPRTRLSLSFALGVTLCAAVGGLWAWHVYLLATNQTSVEWQANRSARRRERVRGRLWVNPYDLRDWRENARQVFGGEGLPLGVCLLWPLPPGLWRGSRAPGRPPGDGTSFVTVHQRGGGLGGAARRAPTRLAGSSGGGGGVGVRAVATRRTTGGGGDAGGGSAPANAAFAV